MVEYLGLVDEAAAMADRRPEAAPGLLLLADGFANRAARRAARRG